MEDSRFRHQQAPRNEPPINPLVSPSRGVGRIPQQQQLQQPSSHDLRSSLPRRFTTDSGLVPTLSSISSLTSPPRRTDTSQDYTGSQDYNNALHKAQLVNIEKKRFEYERIREQRRLFEIEIHALEQKQRQEAEELVRMEEEASRYAGHQSEPTTPPEYRNTNNGFPSIFARPNRFSTSSLTSPPGLFGRPLRSGSLLDSPLHGPSSLQQPYGLDDVTQMPSRSVPITRRNSDDDDKEEAVRQDPSSQRSTNS
ncbi:hypothetical protein HDV64DRAFT_37641 [Trichoderma sp. TUCIM 5745]